MKSKMKLQSAMEYLMTYGWAILVIAVVMVALFSLGILGGGTPFGTTCLAQSGYVCSSPIFSATSGNLLVTVGQATGTNWATANIIFVPAGVSTSNPLALFNTANIDAAIGFGNNAVLYGGLITEQQAVVNVVVANIITPGTSFKVGQTTSGTLWAQYQTVANGPFYYAQLSTVTLKAA
jgi:hypothetical protein